MGKGGLFVLRTLMRRIIRVVWLVVICLILAIIPWMIENMINAGYSLREILQSVAGVFALGSVLLGIYQVAMHLDNFNNPQQQKHVIRVLFMVPIYSLNAWLALMFPDAAMYLDTVRRNYEAFALYSFFVYVVEALGGEANVLRRLASKDEMPAHIFPLCCLYTWEPGLDFYRGVQTGIHGYVFFQVLTSLIAVCLYPFGLYSRSLEPDSVEFYFTIINNFVSMWAIYCLVIFYLALQTELNRIGALLKFLCIKCVIFLSWWQSVFLEMFQQIGWLPNSANFSANEVSVSIQDFCICIEMLFLAIVHMWAFSYKEFRAPLSAEAEQRDSSLRRAISMFDFRDMGQDVLNSARNPVMPSADTTALTAVLDPLIPRPSPQMMAAIPAQDPDDTDKEEHLPPIPEEPELEEI